MWRRRLAAAQPLCSCAQPAAAAPLASPPPAATATPATPRRRHPQTAPPRYGLEFVRYALAALWRLPGPSPAAAYLRGRNVARVFDGHVRALRQSTVKRLRYYAKYIPEVPPTPT